MKRFVLACGLALFALLSWSSPAAAHSGGSVEATNYRSTLQSVTPAMDGVALRIVDLGDQLELRNNSPRTIEVLGYDDEPYLRIEPDGVWRNRNSPATYLNESQDSTNPVPAYADSDAAPQWDQLSTEPVVTWHDHRIHWMGVIDAPIARTAPDDEHVIIPQWDVQLFDDGQPVTASGNLVWIPGPSPLPWFTLMTALVLLAIAGASIARTRRLTMVVVPLLMIVGDIIHVSGVVTLGAGTMQTRVSDGLEVLLPSVLAWGVGVLGIRQWWVRDPNAPSFLVFSSALLLFLNGVSNFGDLSSSQIPFAGPDDLARGALAVVIGGGVATLVTSVWSLAAARRRKTETENRSILSA